MKLHEETETEILQALLQAGHDPNEAGPDGITPLMLFQRTPEANRLLLAAGADPNARDALGYSVLEHQTGYSVAAIGYCRPDFAGLDVLVEGGARRPDAQTARNWVETANSQVCSAGEASNATAFARWVALNTLPS